MAPRARAGPACGKRKPASRVRLPGAMARWDTEQGLRRLLGRVGAPVELIDDDLDLGATHDLAILVAGLMEASLYGDVGALHEVLARAFARRPKSARSM